MEVLNIEVSFIYGGPDYLDMEVLNIEVSFIYGGPD